MTDPIVAAARFLAGQLPWLRHRPPAELAEFLADVDACHRRLTGLARGPAARRYLGPCGAELSRLNTATVTGVFITEQTDWVCDGEVYAVRGADSGRCGTCGTTYPVEERAAWLDGLVRERNYRAVHLAEAYDISVDTIRSWAQRGKLVPHGHDQDGRPLYNAGEVLELDKQARDRKAERQARKDREMTYETKVTRVVDERSVVRNDRS